ncbi:unnamed protein product [Blepharisma stoltei]|uniref:Uncharacterized protein n=1 Tax=Blepharisma stoltei TaxID=1481888 RepID=A0AAU9JTT4_9CILI|nr:unnamed protein product [Blepharisma stoltei]
MSEQTENSRLEDLSQHQASSTEITLNEEEVPQILNSLQGEAISKILEEDYIGAISILKRCEEILESVITHGGKTDPDQVLATLHNLALCFQRLGDLEKCAAYLDGCLFNLNSFQVMTSEKSQILNEIRRNTYKSKIHIQSCAVLSQMKKHKAALTHAQNSFKAVANCVKMTITASGLLLKSLKNKPPDLGKQIHKIINSAVPTIKVLENFIKTGKLSHPPKIRSVLGVKSHPDWLDSFTIADVMLMQPISSEELKKSIGMQAEFTKDFILYKVCLLAISNFCVATEIQFIHSNQIFREKNDKEAELYHEKSIELLRVFFPPESPLLKHIQESYIKRFMDSTIEEQTMPLISAKTKPNKKARTISKTPTPRIDKLKNEIRPGTIGGFKTSHMRTATPTQEFRVSSDKRRHRSEDSSRLLAFHHLE